MRKWRTHSLVLLSVMALFGCQTPTDKMSGKNRLANESSPYLLQHADNPVDWYPWGAEALEKAKKEDKPILVSIGYSSCHWCHVMAHESFEDSAVAAMMNEYFVNIKIDREERPDIDQIYMDAVHAMGLRGGWPLNVFLTPDQKPFYGGTYFPKQGWTELIGQINSAFSEHRDQLETSAEKFTQALNANASEKYYLDTSKIITREAIWAGVEKLIPTFGNQWGGLDRAPKFPMPSIWQFLLNAQQSFGKPEIKDHVLFTADKMLQGGIYDQIGGGFARYSTDGEWHVPHFEKMLYDNAQLLSFYANAYRVEPKPAYLAVINETIEWLQREMLDESGGFYAALDADSEGVEGKYYVWDFDEFNALAGDQEGLLATYFDVSQQGNWEETNVLRILNADSWKSSISSEAEFEAILTDFKSKALKVRGKRIPPGLDNKLIAGWNGLLLTGLSHAVQVTRDSTHLQLANNLYAFIKNALIKDKLLHISGQPVQGFAEDYAAVIQGLTAYYQTTFDLEAIKLAGKLTDQFNDEFYDAGQRLYYSTGKNAEKLIARQAEVPDNVIASPNSIMADNLITLSILMDKPELKTQAVQMVNQTGQLMMDDIGFMANWANVAIRINNPVPEIVIIGPEAKSFAQELNQKYLPGKVIMASETSTDALPLMKSKEATGGKTTIYVCFDRSCKLPVLSVTDALKQIPTN